LNNPHHQNSSLRDINEKFAFEALAKCLIASAALWILSYSPVSTLMRDHPDRSLNFPLTFNLLIAYLSSLVFCAITYHAQRKVMKELNAATRPEIFKLLRRANDPFRKSSSFFTIIYFQGFLAYAFCSKEFIVDHLLLLFAFTGMTSFGLCILSHYTATLHIREKEAQEPESEP
jgi:hypothetical protein